MSDSSPRLETASPVEPGSDNSIDLIFPQTIEQSSHIVSQEDNVGPASCFTTTLETIKFILWPIYWLVFHMLCCCLCRRDSISKFDKEKIGVMAKIKKNLKHLKKKKVNEDLKTVFAMV